MEEVPTQDYEIPLGKAEIIKEGKNVTVVGWGAQMTILQEAVKNAEEQMVTKVKK